MDFDMLGLDPRLVATLRAQGITDPTPIQKQAIPHAMNGQDVMGLAQTGTGKTAAFGLPMMDALLKMGGKLPPKGTRGLVLAPTRELARQISENLAAYGKDARTKIQLIVGGAGIGGQIKRMERGADVVIATPGRLIDLLDRRAIRLDDTRFLVLDEADQMLDLGFIHALRRIARMLPAERQTMLFSATMPKQMAELAAEYLTDPVRVQVAAPGKAADKITQSVHFVEQAGKANLLVSLLDQHRDERAIVFGRTKHGSEKLYKKLEALGFAAAAIHGNKSQGQRDRALASFKSGEVKILVATDVAARGIDIPDVKHVYNFDLPNVPENYVHRIGRTARAGADGAAVALSAPHEMDDLRGIEKAMKADIPVAGGEPWAHVSKTPAKGGRRRGGGGGGGGGGRPGGQKRRAPRRRAA